MKNTEKIHFSAEILACFDKKLYLCTGIKTHLRVRFFYIYVEKLTVNRIRFVKIK